MDKEEIKKRQTEILGLIKGFTDEKLDEEYFELSKNLLMKLGRKREVPFVRGRLDVWAGGIIYAIGSINFLFDKSFEPYVPASEIADYFNAGQSTISSKAKTIKDLTKIGIFDSEFSTEHVKNNNPFNDLIVTDNGFILPKSSLNNHEVTNEPLSFIQRMARDFGEDEKIIEKAIKEDLMEKYDEIEIDSVMSQFNLPMDDDEFYSLDDDEFDEFDEEFGYLLNGSNEYYDESSALNYDVNFLEACTSLIDLVLMILTGLKHDYNWKKLDDRSEDFDFNKDISILYKQKHDEISDIINKSAERFDKLIKNYNNDNNMFSDKKVEFDNIIYLNGNMEFIENTSIPGIKNYFLGINHIKELAKKIMGVKNNYKDYKDFKTVLKLLVGELSNIEKYYEEFINKLKNL
jgi:hypothetical protein